MSVSKQLKIMFWNAQSIANRSKQQQLEIILQSEKIDIILIAESFLKQHHNFSIKNFTVYRNDRQSQAHGGVMIAVRNTIYHKTCEPIDTQIIENISIEVNLHDVLTRITAAYCPKSSPHFADDIKLLTGTNSKFMIFGDLNAKHSAWNCSSINTSGNSLFSLQQNNEFIIYHPDSHTHYPHSGQTPSTIDLLLSNVDFPFDLTAFHDQMLSDHVPIVYKSGGADRIERKIFDYKNADWNKFRNYTNSQINSIGQFDSPAEIDVAVERLSSIIIAAREISVPVQISNDRSTISAHTKQVIQLKNAMKRQWKRMADGPEKRAVKREVNKIQVLVKQLVDSDYNSSATKQLSNIKKGAKKLWNLTKQARGKVDNHVSKIKIPGLQTVGDDDKAN